MVPQATWYIEKWNTHSLVWSRDMYCQGVALHTVYWIISSLHLRAYPVGVIGNWPIAQTDVYLALT